MNHRFFQCQLWNENRWCISVLSFASFVVALRIIHELVTSGRDSLAARRRARQWRDVVMSNSLRLSFVPSLLLSLIDERVW